METEKRAFQKRSQMVHQRVANRQTHSPKGRDGGAQFLGEALVSDTQVADDAKLLGHVPVLLGDVQGKGLGIREGGLVLLHEQHGLCFVDESVRASGLRKRGRNLRTSMLSAKAIWVRQQKRSVG